jgi:uncharacterized protein involved in response to NO
MDVLVIAGLRHTGRSLDLPWQAHAALALMLCAAAVRVLPELGIATFLHGPHYAVAAALRSAAFGVWLLGFLPMMRGRRCSGPDASRQRLEGGPRAR